MIWAVLLRAAVAGAVFAAATTVAGARPLALAGAIGIGVYIGTLVEYVGWGRGDGK